MLRLRRGDGGALGFGLGGGFGELAESAEALVAGLEQAVHVPLGLTIEFTDGPAQEALELVGRGQGVAMGAADGFGHDGVDDARSASGRGW